MNKKADLKMTIKAIVGILIGLIILFALVLPVGRSIWDMFFPDTSQMTRESFNILKNTVNDLGLYQINSEVIFLKKGEMLVSFDNHPNKGSGEMGYYDRPELCYNKACLIVCRNNNDPKSCLNSQLVASYDSVVSFEPTQTQRGLVTIGVGEYVSLELELLDGGRVKIIEKTI